MRRILALIGLLAFMLSSLHAGPVAAHVDEHSSIAAITQGHGHDHIVDEEDQSSTEAGTDQGHHHGQSGAAPQAPQADLDHDLYKQILFASEAMLMLLGGPAPPHDPPKA